MDKDLKSLPMSVEENVAASEILLMDHLMKVADTSPQDSSTSSVSSQVALVWTDLSCVLRRRISLLSLCPPLISDKFRKDPSSRKTHLLKSQSGSVSSGELVAIIGPSGAGKSTLLKCLSGRKTEGVSGDIYVKCDNSSQRKGLSFAFLDQRDSLLGRLTVRECLTFASRIKNGSWTTRATMHHEIADKIIRQLNLSNCADILVVKISGGQQRRLSIGLELINAPRFLLLDEPTSGLDSNSALQCVQLLKDLVEDQNLAIIVSLHQPSARILSLFHRINVLSHDGRLLFNDSAEALHPRLASLGFPCPPLHNLADHAIELASGVFGSELLDTLSSSQIEQNKTKNLPLSVVVKSDAPQENRINFETGHTDTDDNADANGKDCHESQQDRTSVRSIADRMRGSHKSKFFYHLYLLTLRTLLLTIRTPWLNVLRFLGHIVTAIIVSVLYNTKVGSANGCVIPMDNSKSLLEVINAMQNEQVRITDNLSQFFFSLMFHVFANMMLVVMTFPLEMSVMVKERSNGCYSCLTYYLAKSLADVPFTLFNATLYVGITYCTTGQIMSVDRFTIVLAVCILMAFVGQSTGLLVGALWVHRPDEAMFMAPVSTLPMFLLSGFFVKIETMPTYLRPLASLSYWRWGFEAIIVATYGRGRCNEVSSSSLDTTSKGPLNECTVFGRLMKVLKEADIDTGSMVSWLDIYFAGKPELVAEIKTIEKDLRELRDFAANSTSSNGTADGGIAFYQNSYVLQQFNLTDDKLYENFAYLISFVALCRLAAYAALYYKASHK